MDCDVFINARFKEWVWNLHVINLKKLYGLKRNRNNLNKAKNHMNRIRIPVYGLCSPGIKHNGSFIFTNLFNKY